MLRAAMRARVAQAVPDLFTNPIIYLKIESNQTARIIAHSEGELGIMRFRQVLPGDYNPKTGHEVLVNKGYRLKERNAEVVNEGMCDVYEKIVGNAGEFDWNVQVVYVLMEGLHAKLIVHHPREGRIEYHDHSLSAKQAHVLLVSKGFQLKDRFVDVPNEGTCDVYENPTVVVPVVEPFNWESKSILVKSEGSAMKLVARSSTGIRQVHDDTFNPKSAHATLTEKGYIVKDRFVEDEIDGLCDVYEKLEVVEAVPAPPVTVFNATNASSSAGASSAPEIAK